MTDEEFRDWLRAVPLEVTHEDTLSYLDEEIEAFLFYEGSSRYEFRRYYTHGYGLPTDSGRTRSPDYLPPSDGSTTVASDFRSLPQSNLKEREVTDSWLDRDTLEDDLGDDELWELVSLDDEDSPSSLPEVPEDLELDDDEVNADMVKRQIRGQRRYNHPLYPEEEDLLHTDLDYEEEDL